MPSSQRRMRPRRVSDLPLRYGSAVALGAKLVDGMGQADIALGETAGIMRREDNLDAVVDVEPFGMVIHLLRHERHLAHEAPGLAEGAEVIDLADRIAVIHLSPTAQLLDGGAARRSDQPLDHPAPPVEGRPSQEVADGGAQIKSRSSAP